MSAPSTETIQWYDFDKAVIPPSLTFDQFLYALWGHLGLPSPTELQYDMGDFLSDTTRERILIEAFRGCGKSWITAAYCLYCWARNWDCRILVVSAGAGRADEFSTFCMQVLRSWDLMEPLRPQKETLRQSKIAFDMGVAGTDQAPSCKSLGITSQLAGSRAWLIVSDDVESPRNSLTEMMRSRLDEAIKEYDAIIKPGGRIVFLGTPQCYETVYNKIQSRGYDCRVWPAEVPEDPSVYSGSLSPMVQRMFDEGLVGEPTEPVRFTTETLAGRELSYGRSGYQLQYMLNTSLSDAERYPLKLKDIPVMTVDTEQGPMKVVHNPEDTSKILKELPAVGFTGDLWVSPQDIEFQRAPYTFRSMSIDPSGRGKDETGYAVGLGLNGNIFVPKAGGIQGGYSEETLVQLAEIARDYQVNEVIVESNFGDGMYTELFKPILNSVYPVHLEEINVSQRKELRIIDTLEPVMNAHRLIVDHRVVRDDYARAPKGVAVDKRNNFMLFWQMTRITKDKGSLKHDDRLDALALLVSRFVSLMSADRDKGISSYQEKELIKSLSGDHWGIFGKAKRIVSRGVAQTHFGRH